MNYVHDLYYILFHITLLNKRVDLVTCVYLWLFPNSAFIIILKTEELKNFLKLDKLLNIVNILF